VTSADRPADAVVESPFFAVPDGLAAFERTVRDLEPTGGGDEPESGLEALAMAMAADWETGLDKRRHVIVLFTDASAHPLGDPKQTSAPTYPTFIPSTMDELFDQWGHGQSAEALMENAAKRLLIFAPEVYPVERHRGRLEPHAVLPIDGRRRLGGMGNGRDHRHHRQQPSDVHVVGKPGMAARGRPRVRIAAVPTRPAHRYRRDHGMGRIARYRPGVLSGPDVWLVREPTRITIVERQDTGHGAVRLRIPLRFLSGHHDGRRARAARRRAGPADHNGPARCARHHHSVLWLTGGSRPVLEDLARRSRVEPTVHVLPRLEVAQAPDDDDWIVFRPSRSSEDVVVGRAHDRSGLGYATRARRTIRPDTTVCRMCLRPAGSATGTVRPVPPPTQLTRRQEAPPVFGESKHAKISLTAGAGAAVIHPARPTVCTGACPALRPGATAARSSAATARHWVARRQAAAVRNRDPPPGHQLSHAARADSLHRIGAEPGRADRGAVPVRRRDVVARRRRRLRPDSTDTPRTSS